MGGPEKIMNTNGAGDGALAALLHDITANSYHRSNVPNSSKHKFTWLTYSSLAQVCKYANRVSYQVLNQHSPRLTRGLPEREDSLEESYWDRLIWLARWRCAHRAVRQTLNWRRLHPPAAFQAVPASPGQFLARPSLPDWLPAR